MADFIDEDDLLTFEEYLKYQAIDSVSCTPRELKEWHEIFEEAVRLRVTTPKVGLMKLRRLTGGEYRYAVAVGEGVDLWLVLWVRRSPKGEYFVMLPRSDRAWNPHASYHLDGTLHN